MKMGDKNNAKNSVEIEFFHQTLLGCFVSQRRALSKQGKMFLFHFESSFCSSDNQVLTFQIIKCHDVVEFSRMKLETRFT